MSTRPHETPWRPTVRDGMAVTLAIAMTLWVFRFDGHVATIMYRFFACLLTCGAIGTVIARWHGLSRFGGFCLGLMLGPLGVILLTSLRPDEREAQP